MPRYYFHLTAGTERVTDLEGQDLAGLDAAVASALHNARAIMAEEVRAGSLDLTPALEVADDRRTVHRLAFADAVTIHRT